MRLVFVRHGESEASKSGEFSTRGLRHPLTSSGRTEVRKLGESLRSQGVTQLLHSPLLRAVETASILGEILGVEPVEEPALTEGDVGVLEGQDYFANRAQFESVVASWLDGDLAEGFAGGETGLAIVDRFGRLLKRLRTQGTDADVIVLVSHGTAMRTALPRILTGLSTTAAQVQLGATECVVAELVNRRFVARRWGRVEIDG